MMACHCMYCTITVISFIFPVARPDVCPDGTPVVSCFTDPCGECPNYPNARCEANYCGGCNAVYYDERGNNVTDYCRTRTGIQLRSVSEHCLHVEGILMSKMCVLILSWAIMTGCKLCRVNTL